MGEKLSDNKETWKIPEFPSFNQNPYNRQTSAHLVDKRNEANGMKVLIKCAEDVSTGKHTIKEVMQGINSVNVKFVDDEIFAKAFTMVIKEYLNLSERGAKLFHYIHTDLQKDQTMVLLYPPHMYDVLNYSDKTYYKALQELLAKDVLSKRPEPYNFYINTKYIYNGDRLNIVRTYILDTSTKFKANDGESLLGIEQSVKDFDV